MNKLFGAIKSSKTVPNRQVNGWQLQKFPMFFWNLQVIGWLKTNGKFTVLNSTSVFTKVLHVFLEIDELLGGNYKSFVCFSPKSTSYWVAITKVCYVFLKSLEKWVARNSLLQKFAMFFWNHQQNRWPEKRYYSGTVPYYSQ